MCDACVCAYVCGACVCLYVCGSGGKKCYFGTCPSPWLSILLTSLLILGCCLGQDSVFVLYSYVHVLVCVCVCVCVLFLCICVLCGSVVCLLHDCTSFMLNFCLSWYYIIFLNGEICLNYMCVVVAILSCGV